MIALVIVLLVVLPSFGLGWMAATLRAQDREAADLRAYEEHLLSDLARREP